MFFDTGHTLKKKEYTFQVIKMKRLYFCFNCRRDKSTKLKQKHNIYHVNNLKSPLQFTFK